MAEEDPTQVVITLEVQDVRLEPEEFWAPIFKAVFDPPQEQAHG